MTINERQRPSLCGSRTLGIVPPQWALGDEESPSGPPQSSQKESPWALVKQIQFPGPIADPPNQHMQGPGEPRGECALEVLLSSFGKCRPHSAFTDVEPRPGAGACRGHPEIRSCLLRNSGMIFLQPGLSHRHEVDIVQSTLLKCRVCTVLKRLPANKSRVHCSFGCVLA